MHEYLNRFKIKHIYWNSIGGEKKEEWHVTYKLQNIWGEGQAFVRPKFD